MPAPKFDRERASSILAEAHFAREDKAICERWDISAKTLHRYRARLLEDSELSHLVQLKKAALREDWLTDAKSTLKQGMQQLWELMRDLESSPESVHACAGALKILMEGVTMQGFVDARSNSADGAKAQQSRKVDASARSRFV